MSESSEMKENRRRESPRIVFPKDTKLRVGRELLSRGPRTPRGELTKVGTMLGVSPRTLQNWRAWAREGGAMRRPPGRPRRYSNKDRWRALWAVARESRRQGRRAGWPNIKKALGESVPTRLVQEMLAALERRRRQRQESRIRSQRRHVVVHEKGVLWAVDATHLIARRRAGR